MSRILYVDCFAGASGDMFLAALIDLGVPIDVLRAQIDRLRLEDVELRVEDATRHSIACKRVRVVLKGHEILEGQHPNATHDPVHPHAHDDGDPDHDHHHHHGHDHAHHHAPHAHGRRYTEIDALLAGAGLDGAVEALARRVFRGLAEAEASVHGVALEDVHFHEVGAIDAIVDVVGACAGLAHLGADEIVAARVPLGRGMTRGAHGRIPLPAPAVVQLLRGAPVYGIDEDGETITPTGAAILVAAAHRFGAMPAMRALRVGHGAGARDAAARPNLLRLVLGESDAAAASETERLFVVEANLDDMNPEIFAYISDRLFAAGALDVWLTAAQMKKGRPATVLSALCGVEVRDAALSIILRESTSLGVRFFPVERRALRRAVHEVQTPWGAVRVKVGVDDGAVVNSAPEFDDCRRIALEAGVPLKDVYRAAQAAFDARAAAGPGVRPPLKERP